MKHLLTLALVLCLGTFASAQIPSYVPTNGLVGWWPFNGNANDESGNGNHGTVNGAISIADHLNNPGSAFLFGNGRSISVPMSNSLFQMPQRTFVCWFKANGNQSGGRIYETTFRNGGLAMYGGNLLGTWYGYSQHCCNIVGMNGGSLGIWHHLVSIANDITGLTQVFLDGNLLSQSNGYPAGGGCFSNTAWQWQGEFLNFGLGASGESFIGEIDDIAIYNRALTAAEVQQLYLGACTQPTFTAQPQNKSVAQGQTTTFAVQVDTTSTFQWQMNLGLGAGWVNIPQSSLFSGDTTATLSVQGRSTIDGAQFRCIATACQSDTSNAATLTVTSNATTLGSVAGVPGKINYQGAAVDSLGKPMKNQTISLKLSVLDSSSSGAAAYVETHSTPTNGSGLFSLQIGGGTAVTGTFDSIPWANGRNKYLKTEVQQNGTGMYKLIGVTEFNSVPFALFSANSINGVKGAKGDNGKSAYDLWIENGNTGSIQDFFKSLNGNSLSLQNTIIFPGLTNDGTIPAQDLLTFNGNRGEKYSIQAKLGAWTQGYTCNASVNLWIEDSIGNVLSILSFDQFSIGVGNCNSGGSVEKVCFGYFEPNVNSLFYVKCNYSVSGYNNYQSKGGNGGSAKALLFKL